MTLNTLLTATAHSTKQEQMVVWQQRFASVDRIARTLEGTPTTPPHPHTLLLCFSNELIIGPIVSYQLIIIIYLTHTLAPQTLPPSLLIALSAPF